MSLLPDTSPIDDELVRAVVDQVWESLLGAEVLPWYGEGPVAPAVLQAEVTLTGDWNGLVRIGCAQGAAEGIAAAMLMAGADEVLAAEDVHDAVGEVVNVVGGNVKGALLGDTALGLPRILTGPRTGDEVGPATAAAEPVSRCVLDWHGVPVTVEVFTRENEKECRS